MDSLDRTTLYQLRDAIAALEDDDRENLRALLDHAEQKTAVRTTMEEELLWKALVQAAPIGSRHFKSLSDFLRDRRHGVTRADYADACRLVFDLVLEAKPVRHPQQDAAALLDICLDCLVGDLRRRGVEITPKALLANVDRVRTALEYSFPGYLGAGLLHRLIRTVAVA